MIPSIQKSFKMIPYTPDQKEVKKEIKRLIPLIREEFKMHSLIDLTVFVDKKSKEGFKHPGFVRNMAFKMEALGDAEAIPLKEWQEFYTKKTVWHKRHPYWYTFKIGIIGLLFAISVGLANALFQTWLKSK